MLRAQNVLITHDFFPCCREPIPINQKIGMSRHSQNKKTCKFISLFPARK